MSRIALSRTVAGSRVCRQRLFVQRERLLFRTLMQGLQWKNVYKMTQLPSGPYIKGESVLKSAKVGVEVSEARCAGPLSLLISKREKFMSSRSSTSEPVRPQKLRQCALRTAATIFSHTDVFSGTPINKT